MNIENSTIHGGTVSRKVLLARAHLSALASEICISARAHENREFALAELPALLDSGEIDCTSNGVAIDAVCSAWMLCSYGSTRGKHIVKAAMNRLIEREILAADIQVGYHLQGKKRDKPRILVVSSFLRSKHAVFRWFGPSLAALASDFDVRALCFTDIDDTAAKIFQHVTVAEMVPADFFAQLKGVVSLIEASAPDIILYADCAMHPFAIFAANMRLAPLQLLMAGHPASSYSRHMDYFMHEQTYSDCFRDFTEKPLLYPSEHFAMHRAESPPRTAREIGNGKVRILAPATLPKLSRPFVSMLGEIMGELSPSNFELHITTHASDEQHAQVSKDIHDALGQPATRSNVHIYKRLPSERYFTLLDQCDMFLDPFPFQSSTMILDCLERGMPGISMCNNEIMTRQGAEAMRKFGLGASQFIALTPAGYREKAIALAREIKETPIPNRVQPQESIYSNPSTGVRDAILRVLT